MAFIIGSAAKTHFSFETTGKEAGEGGWGGEKRENADSATNTLRTVSWSTIYLTVV